MGMRVMTMGINGAATRTIRRILLHPQYDQFTSDYDIALLELSAPVFFNDLVQPVCVPASSHSFTTRTSCYVTGWGVLREDGELASRLQEASVKVINRNTCNKLYDDAVTPRMLCAGNLQGGVDACQATRCIGDMMNCALVCLFCGLYGVLAKDKEQKGKYSVPILDVKTRQLVLDTNQTLLLSCRGRWELTWAFPSGVTRDQVRVEHSRCGRTSQQYCSRVTVSHSRAQDTGLFRCRYRHRPRKQTSVYVYVTDSQQPFVEHPDMSPDVLYLKEKQPLVIPCRVTHPNVTTTLVKLPSHSLSPDQRNIIWSSKQGFTIRTPTFYYIGLFFCQTVIDGVTHKSHKYFVHRPVSNIMDVYLNSSGPVQALKGKRLVLNCTATGELNSRVNISWDYPGKSSNVGSTSKRLHKQTTHILFYNILTIPKLQRSDRGLYTCRVTSGEKTKQQKVTVTVYDRPFIRLKPRHGSVMEAQAGQKSYRISPKLKAFPAPEVIWLKDGMVAAEQCSRYHMDGHSLVIRDVAEEDAGTYTVLVRIQEHGLFQNITLTLVVNAQLHRDPDAALEEAQALWTRLGPADRGLTPGPWVHSWVWPWEPRPLLSGPSRRRTELPVRKSERFSSRCLASSPMRDASQQRDCPFVFKRGTVRFLKSLIYS
ncbi:hypothetical protein F2P81_019196 [Scophthalmus maximus]|uniref:Platelet-derived growth factor receptor-like protein n=1 Tax=Scophthalmus maximus TaxID=52904 RepID=A0A6A4S6F9_SCOMX|nr:hypothetical protein F2P81_019196 [Scophthalmus maximus]